MALGGCLREADCVGCSVRVADDPICGRGLFCASDVTEGGLLLGIRAQAVLSFDDVVAFCPALGHVDEAIAFAVFLVCHHYGHLPSPWSSWLQLLEDTTQSDLLATCGAPAAVEEWTQDGECAARFAVEQKEVLHHYTATLLPLAARHGCAPSAEQLLRAVGFVQSRWLAAEPAPRMGRDRRAGCPPRHVMAPGIDFANHSPDALLIPEWTEAGDLSLVADRDYRAGEQVFICYGHKPNLEFLLHYGFILDSNPIDKVRLEVAVAEGSDTSDVSRLLRLLQLETPFPWWVSRGRADVPESVMCVAILACMTAEEVQDALIKAAAAVLPEDEDDGLFAPCGATEDMADALLLHCSPVLKRRATQRLAAVCHAWLAARPTTLAADLALLPGCPPEHRWPLQYRIARKRLVVETAQALEARSQDAVD
eukprot:EG_transcript_12553